jgi:hypothetical protein
MQNGFSKFKKTGATEKKDKDQEEDLWFAATAEAECVPQQKAYLRADYR